MKPDPKRAAVLLTCLARPLDEAPRLVLSDLFELIGEEGRALALRRNGYWHVDQNGTVTWRTGRTSRPRWYIGRAGPKPDGWGFVDETVPDWRRVRPGYRVTETRVTLPWWVCRGSDAESEPRHLTFSATTGPVRGDGWRCQVCTAKIAGPVGVEFGVS